MGVLGANKKTSTARPRVADSSDSNDFMRQRPTAQPMARLPRILNSPMTASAQPPTSGANPQAAITPGRCVARKAPGTPQPKNPPEGDGYRGFASAWAMASRAVNAFWRTQPQPAQPARWNCP